MSSPGRQIPSVKHDLANTLRVTAATTLKRQHKIVHVTPPATSTYTVTPEHPGAMAGEQVLFVSDSAPGGGVVVAGFGYTSSDNLEAAQDRLLIMSDGERWFEVLEACA